MSWSGIWAPDGRRLLHQQHNTALLNECFDKLGPWIVSCHAKDLTWEVEMNVHFREIAPGKGSLDYGTYLKRIAQLPEPPTAIIGGWPLVCLPVCSVVSGCRLCAGLCTQASSCGL